MISSFELVNDGGPGTVKVWAEITQVGYKQTKYEEVHLESKESKTIRFTFMLSNSWIEKIVYRDYWVEN